MTNEIIWNDASGVGSYSMALGDVDNDGDLDMAVGNFGVTDCFSIGGGARNYVYENVNGAMTTNVLWDDNRMDDTMAVAWGDVDNDGDLDLAVGNWSGNNYLSRNS